MNKIFNTLILVLFSLSLSAMEYKNFKEDDEYFLDNKQQQTITVERKKPGRSKSQVVRKLTRQKTNKTSSGKNTPPSKNNSPFWRREVQPEDTVIIKETSDARITANQEKLNKKLALAVSYAWLKKINQRIEQGADLESEPVQKAIKNCRNPLLEHPTIKAALINNVEWKNRYPEIKALKNDKAFKNDNKAYRIGNTSDQGMN
jgi:hypothetical protein